jgi:putative Ca2+/H+ antiporter (TMEM165/GDT1 family)
MAVILTLGVLGLGILYQQDLMLDLGVVTMADPQIEPIRPVSPQVSLTGSQPVDQPLDLGWGQRWILIFSTVFVAEMGDKTQLATLLMSAQSPSPWGIFLGSAGALVVASLLSVLLGEGLAQVIPRDLLQLIAGISFVGIGLYVVWDAQQEPTETP